MGSILFHFQDNDMDIIDSYNKLTLEKYEEIQEISGKEGLEEVDRVVGILSVLTGASEDDILHLPIGEFTELSAKAKFLSAEGFQAGRIAKRYKFAGWDLIPVTDYRKLETCQYIDFKTYAADMDKHLVELLSVLLVPKGHRYNEGYDIIELQKAIRENMTVTEAVTIAGFFMIWCRKLIEDSLHYSEEEAQNLPKEKREKILEKIKEVQDRLGTSGDGSTA